MTRYHSPWELAHALQEASPDKQGLLFYNEHRPDTTPVWLLPDPYEKPAHHRAKFGVWPWGEDGDQVFVQWCVEKGVEGSAAAHFPASDVLSGRWAWPRFLEEARSKAFDARLKEAEALAGMPLTVRLSLFTAVPGSGRDYQGRESQQMVWQTSQGRLTLQEATGSHVFNEQLPDAPNIRTLALLLDQMPGRDWCWADFGVGVVLPLRQDTWSTHDLYTRILSPWADLTQAEGTP